MPIEAWLLSRVGWRSALTILTVVLGIVTIPMHAALLRRAPAGSAHPRAGSALAAPARGMTLDAARRTAVFWVLSAAFVVSNFATAALSTHLIPYLVSCGYSPTIAATVIGRMGAMQLPSRIVFVPISARLGARVMVATVFLAQALGIGQLPLLGLTGTLLPFILLPGRGQRHGDARPRHVTRGDLRRAALRSDRGRRRPRRQRRAGDRAGRRHAPVGGSRFLPRRFWVLAASLVMAAVALLIAGAGVKSGE